MYRETKEVIVRAVGSRAQFEPCFQEPEVRDLDAYTEKTKVIEALKRDLPDDNFEVSLTNVNARGLRLSLEAR